MISADLPTPRVVVADLRPAMLLAARGVLESEGIDVVATAADLDRATDAAVDQDANVLVVDLKLLAGCSRAMVTELRHALPEVSIIVLTMEAETAFADAVMGAGASGYVLKDYAASDLAEAVRRAVIGRHFVSDKVAA